MPTKKIVLSDHAPLFALLEKSFFLREGFQLRGVADVQSCLKIVEAEEPCLAVLDLAQMGEEAIECCRVIKQDSLLKVTPVILLLPENSQAELTDLCWAAGCDAVASRPLESERLISTACTLLGISRRRARRLPVSFRVVFIDGRKKRHPGLCLNLNSVGLFVATESLFPVDTTLSLEFTLPGFVRPLHSSVRVAWVNHPEWRKREANPCGLGLQFVDPSAPVKAALHKFLDAITVED